MSKTKRSARLRFGSTRIRANGSIKKVALHNSSLDGQSKRNHQVTKGKTLRMAPNKAVKLIHHSIKGWTMVLGLCPPAKTLFGCPADRIYDLSHEGKQ